MKIILLFVGWVVIVWSTPHYSEQYAQCLARAKSHQDTFVCHDNELKYQDILLNQNYQVLIRQIAERLDAKEAKAKQRNLRDIQRLWIKFRDKNCDFYNLYGGSMEIGFVRVCTMRMTAERAEELGSLADY